MYYRSEWRNLLIKLALVFFSIDSLRTFFIRCLTIVAVLAHYILYEKYSLTDLDFTGAQQFVQYIVFWHVITMTSAALAHEVRARSPTPLLTILICLLFGLLVCKFVDWALSASRFERDIFYRKGLLEHLYWLFNLLGAVFFESSGFNFFFFISDNYILSQLSTLFFRNEFNFFAFVSSLPMHL